MNRVNGIENARKNLPHYEAPAAILENTDTRMQRDPIADTACDLPNCLNYSLPRMYADDTSLSYASADLKSADNCINYDL